MWKNSSHLENSHRVEGNLHFPALLHRIHSILHIIYHTISIATKQTNSRIYSMVKGHILPHSVFYSRALTISIATTITYKLSISCTTSMRHRGVVEIARKNIGYLLLVAPIKGQKYCCKLSGQTYRGIFLLSYYLQSLLYSMEHEGKYVSSHNNSSVRIVDYCKGPTQWKESQYLVVSVAWIENGKWSSHKWMRLSSYFTTLAIWMVVLDFWLPPHTCLGGLG